ncbi:putative pentatricopeptide repeat-containing protein At3g49142 [Dendrobium catenatum]|uniref:Pentatricopeptide repeat-containing protein n=1 Tax=Dendrobium catenatum TaxID=906689 RepID=A0A2I0XB29_9ASPA|nr:putative pentatricopeptide repeat-containing protein At3g49142 [Dendrobium catenatum]XP_020700001.1 putative pentatricopeptide repeat-containing protein At3g49142 [Dendrobium catenatum]XP_020700002.1 putative pentatricopeptide repeat-containing protein At3g49142 [Dendrobium catenatum]XP_028548707.1 putative pentatricopeptide repeat-containing protein At3g49142 [Dendrobium catenatum]PKU85096.1 Putative pentatricopeptide repeat-containing protein [Dendrobium catenatum]
MKFPNWIFSINVFFRCITNARQISDEALLRSVDECRNLFALQNLHAEVVGRRHLTSNPSVAVKLMRAYATCGDTTSARHVFDESPERNVVFFNVMIRSYVGHGLYGDALLLFSEMERFHGVKPDNYTYPCVLKACSCSEKLCGGVQIHGAATKLGLDSNLFVGNALISLYAMCGCCADAQQVFDGMPKRDVVSWNAIISGHAQRGLNERALQICREMVLLKRSSVDAGTMASISLAMSNSKPDDIEFVKSMFEEIKGRNLISWNAMIAIYVKNSMAAEAMELFGEMKKVGTEPDEATIASVLTACRDLMDLTLGKQLHEFINKKNMCPNLTLENALMDMYATCGCLQEAQEVFSTMRRKDVASWTTIISAYGMHGHGREAIVLFEQMQELGYVPDHIAYVSVLSACSYSGLLDAGKYYFNCMTSLYNLVPRMEHYACMVDLLGRAGQVDEAYDLVRKMPMDPNERVWGALLAACRVHSNMSIGLVAADHLFRLVPKQAGYYVLLSNIYARAGRWKDVALVRGVMVCKGIKKLPGRSNVELGNKIHTFYIGDTSHSQSKEIYAELDVLMRRLKEAGYSAETETALHDVEEEDKEGHLLVHSEKLAIVFALINCSPGTPIRITMNLRMCGDCHLAAKLVSRITAREIILKDTNRFHHFQCGSCSCGDYW